MEKRVEAILVCILLIAFSLVIVFPVEAMKLSRNSLFVGGSGPGNYTKIQDAIDNASDGNLVYVYDDSSPYKEHLIVLKSVIITGENKDTTEIYGIGEDKHLMTIKSSYVTISNFTIRYGSDHYTGILIKDSSHIVILDCKFSDIPFMDAITVSNSENITIINCIMSDSIGKDESGINKRYVSGITLESGCINTTISGNKISNASVAGILVLEGCYNTRILSNSIFSCDGFGIDVFGSDTVFIKENKILNNPNIGIAIINCNNTLIFRNLCENTVNAPVGISDTINTYIKCNNFINFGILGFFIFDYGIGFSNYYINNNWEENYWGRSRIFPKPILGGLTYKKDAQSPTIFVPWLMFDRYPAKEPYDIP